MDRIQLIREAFTLGFMVSREGFNGECPFSYLSDGLVSHFGTEEEFREHMAKNPGFIKILDEVLIRLAPAEYALSKSVIVAGQEVFIPCPRCGVAMDNKRPPVIAKAGNPDDEPGLRFIHEDNSPRCPCCGLKFNMTFTYAVPQSGNAGDSQPS